MSGDERLAILGSDGAVPDIVVCGVSSATGGAGLSSPLPPQPESRKATALKRNMDLQRRIGLSVSGNLITDLPKIDSYS